MNLGRRLHAALGGQVRARVWQGALAAMTGVLVLGLAGGCQAAEANSLGGHAGEQANRVQLRSGRSAHRQAQHRRLRWGGREAGRKGAPRHASATLEKCVTAVAQSERYATFAGQMKSGPGTEEMAIRIDLLEREPGQAFFHRVEAPGLGQWRTSEPGVKIFKVVKQITNLGSPGAYRALVRFHWIDAEGDIFRRARSHTQTCRQPSLQEPGLGGEAATARMPGR